MRLIAATICMISGFFQRFLPEAPVHMKPAAWVTRENLSWIKSGVANGIAQMSYVERRKQGYVVPLFMGRLADPLEIDVLNRRIGELERAIRDHQKFTKTYTCDTAEDRTLYAHLKESRVADTIDQDESGQ